MIYFPINRKRQLVTQRMKRGHNGVDLRCVNDLTHENLDVTATEKSELLRQGCDAYGNYFVVLKPLEFSGLTEFKFIHINKTDFDIGKIFKAGETIGRCIVGGNSKSLHLHFEAWKGKAPFDPIQYFKDIGIEYDIKPGA
jgi:murein DD-endopeptidase MepM/ murein hydrolase activator NlpD